MGCFSFICKVSGEPINSSSYDGDPVHLFLLKDGVVIEHMYGNYDSYGQVFSSPDKEGSFKWQMPWDQVCDLIFHSDHRNGIAAIHHAFWCEGQPYPTTRSEDDPNQGWGKDGEFLTSSRMFAMTVNKPFHKVLRESV